MKNMYTKWQKERYHSVNLKLNDYEADMLKLKSAKANMNKSEYLRELICGSCPVEAPPKKFYDAVNELNKIGVTIHQMFLRIKVSESVSDTEVQFFHDTADEVFDRLTEIKRIVLTARPYAIGYFENLAIKQRKAKHDGIKEPKLGDDIFTDTEYKHEDEPDETKVEVLYETTGADVIDESYDINSYFNRTNT